MKVTVTRKLEIAADICEFHLTLPGNQPLPPFAPGAHIDVHLGALVRQYSLCNDPIERDRYVLGVLKEPSSRGGAKAMHALSEGDELEVSEPKNNFSLDCSARHSILFAGGIGVTPILSMFHFMARRSISFEMHYCIRARSRAAFVDRLSGSELSARANVYCDSEPSVGQLDLSKVLRDPDPRKHLYVCGPGGFIEACLSAADAAGWSEANLHRESFAVAANSSGPKEAFDLKLARSNRTVRVAPGQRVIDALTAAGVCVPSSCLEGTCGTCLTTVLDGEPDHRDAYLTKKERTRNDRFLPCCSRSKTSVLVLDL
ncbi:PDR/VanB family oxidoreductase [Mesorhizobium sp. M0923]|uniref:PDR/VanB family oxidoreductase n=1 Tax=unclassified Mesorhizobium TaxID=325217 RepID=UPI0004160BCD|nr:PDR/VanB family oxidoreductase [Mesorhizobium sp. L48C026A00]